MVVRVKICQKKKKKFKYNSSYKKTKTIKDDLSTKTERNREKYIQAHKCLNNCLQSGIVSDDSIKEAQNKIDKILYIESNKKTILILIGIFIMK